MKNLLPIEKEFIDFYSIYSNNNKHIIKKIYIKIKNIYDFSGIKYRQFCLDTYQVNQLTYINPGENKLIELYKAFELMHTFRFISYKYPPKNTFIQLLIEFSNKLRNKQKFSLSDFIYQNLPTKTPIIIDYGAGLGHLSFEISKKNKPPKVYIVDINALPLKFALYRFKKHKISVKPIYIDTNNIYPKLPKHHLCIASEVLEHVKNPITALNHINASLSTGGILYGNFSNHTPGIVHVSPKLTILNNLLNKHYTSIGNDCYQKK